MAATVSFQQAVTSGGAGNPKTLSFTVASAAGQERLVAICAIVAKWDAPFGTRFRNLTIDGQAATQLGGDITVSDGSPTNGPYVTFWRAAGTANTSINVIFDVVDSSTFDARGALWTLSNATTLLANTPGTIGSPVTGNLSLDINTVAGGAVAALVFAYGSSQRTMTWSGLTERYDGIADSLYGVDWFSVADLNAGSASTPLTVTATLPTDFTSNQAVAGLAVSFDGGGGPATILMPQICL